ncbi:hypothetical protein BH10PSE18_BH10PSE18_21880 [soil metagenome]
MRTHPPGDKRQQAQRRRDNCTSGVPGVFFELLSPALALALPRFAPGTVFRMLVDESFIADGRVLRLLPDA